MEYTSDVAFTPAVKAIQAKRGSRTAYARLERRGGFADALTPGVRAFIEDRDSAYLATASADGRPYVQHRGGPRGFLKIIDDTTIAFADFTGNKQYISTGNLAENPKAFLFLMDYAHRRRIKIWGEAEIVTPDEPLLRLLADDRYAARIEQAIVFHVSAWDANCPQHIPQLVPLAEVERVIAGLRQQIADLERAAAKARTGANEAS